ncbi:MAG: DUF123 domain-containing protein [Candidatus Methylomirabilales bacterium]
MGCLGEACFPTGYYAYTGSAMGGILARIARHRQKDKRIRWHIDYLLQSPEAAVVLVLAFPGTRRKECRLNRRIAALPGARVILPGFGCSDCRRGCRSHLIHFAELSPARPPLQGPLHQGKKKGALGDPAF